MLWYIWKHVTRACFCEGIRVKQELWVCALLIFPLREQMRYDSRLHFLKYKALKLSTGRTPHPAAGPRGCRWSQERGRAGRHRQGKFYTAGCGGTGWSDCYMAKGSCIIWFCVVLVYSRAWMAMPFNGISRVFG